MDNIEYKLRKVYNKHNCSISSIIFKMLLIIGVSYLILFYLSIALPKSVLYWTSVSILTILVLLKVETRILVIEIILEYFKNIVNTLFCFKTISAEVYELGRSILTDPNWYLACKYFYNKRWDDQDVETLVHKGQLIKINRGIEICDNSRKVKFTGTGISFLTTNEQEFLYEIIKIRLLDDMVYKEEISI